MEPLKPEEEVQGVIHTMSAAIVPDSGAVTVEYKLGGDAANELHYTVHCNPADARFIIGKKGVNAEAIRAIAWAASAKLKLPKVLVFFDVPALNITTSQAAPAAAII